MTNFPYISEPYMTRVGYHQVAIISLWHGLVTIKLKDTGNGMMEATRIQQLLSGVPRNQTISTGMKLAVTLWRLHRRRCYWTTTHSARWGTSSAKWEWWKVLSNSLRADAEITLCKWLIRKCIYSTKYRRCDEFRVAFWVGVGLLHWHAERNRDRDRMESTEIVMSQCGSPII